MMLLSDSYSSYDLTTRIRKYHAEHILPRMMCLDVDYDVTFDSTFGPVRDMALDLTESRYLLSAYRDGSLALFDVDWPQSRENGQRTYPQLNQIQPRRRMGYSPGASSPINCIQWYPVDSGSFFTASVDKKVSLWDTCKFECVDVITVPEMASWISLSDRAVTHNLVAVALSRGETGRAVLLDPLIGASVITLFGAHSSAGLSAIVWSHRSSHFVVTGGHDGRILFWDIRTPVKPFCSLDRYNSTDTPLYSHDDSAHTGPVLSLAFTLDGMHLLSWGGAGLSDDMTCLRMWSGGPDDTASPQSFRPVLRPVNFGTVYTDGNAASNQLQNDETRPARTKRFSVRMAVASGSPGAAWGGEAAFVFIPARSRLLTASARRWNPVAETIIRHHDEIRACVWNPLNQELYTGALDGNLFVWPLYRRSSDDEQPGQD